MWALVLLALSVALLLERGAGQVINSEVTRTIDASSAIVKLTADIKAVNVKGEYQVAFPTSTAKSLAFLTVSLKGKSLPISAPVRCVCNSPR